MAFNRKGWVFAGAAALLLPPAVRAQEAETVQDIGTSTPPELRDFRLDTPPPKTTPEPTPPPLSKSQTPATSDPRPATNQQPTINPTPVRQPQPRAITPPRASELVEPAPATVAPDGDNTDTAATPDIGTENAGNVSAEEAKPAATDRGLSRGYIWMGAALAALSALLVAALLLRRRQKRRFEAREALLPAQQPSPPARLDKPKPLMVPPSPLKAPTATPPSPRPEPVFAEFKPESAQLSIASLSVTGKLTIINRGQTAIDNLLMRSHMISAQNGQQEAITAFHDAKGSGSLQSLGSLAAGERIDAVIEIRQPRTELSTFRWTEREFVAPIILINLCGLADAAEVEVRLSHLIGRDGGDSAPRMKPLAIDRGPKRFTGVSARPVIA